MFYFWSIESRMTNYFGSLLMGDENRERRIYGEISDPKIHIGASSPLSQQDYENLLYNLAQMPYADQIAVRTSNGWKRKYVRYLLNPDKYNTTEEFFDVSEMAQAALDDKFKASYLEVRLKTSSKDDEDRAVIEFVEWSGMAIGHCMRIPRHFSSVFGLDASSSWTHMYALWTPENLQL